ncbi:MAG: copper amine oxidase N-terminal domain-containing protein [Clostridia bacterium]|nr:copper amine oxidase N-terminal domain-containing protein [Clostridia bacterium]
MKKKLLCTLALIGAMSTSAFAATSAAIDGKIVDNSSVIEENGTTYISVRPIAESLGLDVEWIGETKTVIISNGGPLYITFSIGKNGYTFAKTSPMPLSGAPIVVNSAAYVPTDVLTELLSYKTEENDNILNIITNSNSQEDETTSGQAVNTDKIKADGYAGIVTEVSDDEILFNDSVRGEVRLSKSSNVKVTDLNGNTVDIDSITVDTKLVVEYGEAMTMSIPPLNNPVSIVVCK